MTCFLIDDDIDDQEIFALALRRLDKSITCMTASNGTEALEKLRQNKHAVPDYIFLDLNMPGMSGKQCLVELKKDERLSRIPVIIYTTSSEPNDIADTKELGAFAFLTKPTHLTDLVKELSGILHVASLSSSS